MTTTKMSVSFPEELGSEIREHAEAAGVTVSAWLSAAAAAQVRAEALADALDEYQQEHGAFTEEDIDEGREILGLPRRQRVHRSTA